MILYALRCGGGHAFEAWFRDSAAWESQRAAGHVTCPTCGTDDVEKAPMAPGIPRKASAVADSPLADAAKMRAALGALRAQVEANTEDVGTAFPQQARDMHEGTVETRAIRGKATPEEARALHEDGVPILPLPDTDTGDA